MWRRSHREKTGINKGAEQHQRQGDSPTHPAPLSPTPVSAGGENVAGKPPPPPPVPAPLRSPPPAATGSASLPLVVVGPPSCSPLRGSYSPYLNANVDVSVDASVDASVDSSVDASVDPAGDKRRDKGETAVSKRVCRQKCGNEMHMLPACSCYLGVSMYVSKQYWAPHISPSTPKTQGAISPYDSSKSTTSSSPPTPKRSKGLGLSCERNHSGYPG